MDDKWSGNSFLLVFSSLLKKLVAFLKRHSRDVVPVGFVVGEVPPERVLLREGHPRMFPNLRRTHEYGNLPLNKQLTFYFLTSCPFHRKEFHGNVGTYKIGGSSLSITP
jgi:hypothetical protein